MSGPSTYVVETRISRFQVQAFAGGLLSALGHNPTFAIRGLVGDISLRDDTLEEASLILRVDAGSLQLMDETSERDRREIERNTYYDVLEADRFPEILYVTRSVEVLERGNPDSVKLQGNLTLHGQTRAQAVPAKVSVSGKQVRAFGEFSLWQSDYNIRLVAVAGGTLKIKDELKMKFDIVARRLLESPAEEAA